MTPRRMQRAGLLALSFVIGSTFSSNGWLPAAQAEETVSAPGARLEATAHARALEARVEQGRLLLCTSECSSGAPAVRLMIPEGYASEELHSEVVELSAESSLLVLRFGQKRSYVFVVQGSETSEEAPRLILKARVGGGQPGDRSLRVVTGDDGQEIQTFRRPKVPNLCGRSITEPLLRISSDSEHPRRFALPPLTAAQMKAATVLESAPRPDGSVALRLPDLPGTRRVRDANLETSLGPLLFAEIPKVALEGSTGLVLRSLPGDTSDEESRRVWLATETKIFSIVLSQTGETVVPLVDLGSPSCVGVVRGASPALGEVQLLTQNEAVKARRAPELAVLLSSSNHELAARALLAHPDGVAALAAAIPRLSKAGRARARKLAASIHPAVAAQVWVSLVASGDEADQEDASQRLAAIGPPGVEVIVGQLPEATPAAQHRLSALLIRLDPERAAQVLVPKLNQERAARRLEVRKQLVDVARTDAGFAALGLIIETGKVGDKHLPRRVRSELHRALARELPRASEDAKAQALELLGSAKFSEAYRTAEVAVFLAEVDQNARLLVQGWLDGEGLDAEDRQWAALRVKLLGILVEEDLKASFGDAARASLTSEQMRVRQAAARYAGVSHDEQARPLLSSALAADSWPRVRVESLEALVLLAGATAELRQKSAETPALEEEIAGVLRRDDSPLVRSAAARALGRGGFSEPQKPLRRALAKDRFYEVRTEAARSLGRLCDEESIDRLTDYALELSRAPTQAGAIELGVVSAEALARIDPPDLDKRLEALSSDAVPGALRVRVESAVSRVRGACSSEGEPPTP